MFLISKRLKKRHGIEDERKAMIDAFNEFLNAKGDRKFLGGNEPNLADLELYGAITSFQGTSTFQEMKQQSSIGKWFDDVGQAVSEHKGSSLVLKKSSLK